MVSAIGSTKTKYFRIHDSGDMFNVAYAQCWLEVCRMLPSIRSGFPRVRGKLQSPRFRYSTCS
jgi:hypothetical protein